MTAYVHLGAEGESLRQFCAEAGVDFAAVLAEAVTMVAQAARESAALVGASHDRAAVSEQFLVDCALLGIPPGDMILDFLVQVFEAASEVEDEGQTNGQADEQG